MSKVKIHILLPAETLKLMRTREGMVAIRTHVVAAKGMTGHPPQCYENGGSCKGHA